MKKKLFQISTVAVTAVLLLSSFVTTVFSQQVSGGLALNSDWSVLVNGAVQNTLNLTLAELASFPRTTVHADLTCYGLLVTSGNWAGVNLALVFEVAGISQQAESVSFTAKDGYELRDFPLYDATREDVILAYEKDGQPLSETLRLVVPGANGDVWISMVTQITIKAAVHESVVVPVPPQTPPSPPFSQPSTTLEPSSSSNTSVLQQPENQSAVQQPDTELNRPAEQPELTLSTKPNEYGYAIVATVVGASAAAGCMFIKRGKTNRKQRKEQWNT